MHSLVELRFNVAMVYAILNLCKKISAAKIFVWEENVWSAL